MNKKILSLIAIALMAIVPFKVNAADFVNDDTIEIDGETCPVHNSFYMFHSWVGGWSDAPKTGNNTNQAITNVGIPGYGTDARIIDEGELKLGSSTSLSGGTYSLDKYNTKWFDILGQTTSGYEISADKFKKVYREYGDTDTYILHHTFAGNNVALASYPFFWYYDASGTYYIYNDDLTVSKSEAQAAIKKSYYTNFSSKIKVLTKSTAAVNFEITRNFDLTNHNFSDSNSVNVGRLYGTTDDYRVILPNIFLIQYYRTSECTSNDTGGNDNDNDGDSGNTGTTTKYTLTYDTDGGYVEEWDAGVTVDGIKHDGTISIETFTEKAYIYDEIPIKEGYIFLGWNTSRGASQAQYVGGDYWTKKENATLYAVWLKEGGGKEPPQEGDEPETGLGYSIGIIGTILAATGGGVVYFKKRNKFENI